MPTMFALLLFASLTPAPGSRAALACRAAANSDDLLCHPRPKPSRATPTAAVAAAPPFIVGLAIDRRLPETIARFASREGAAIWAPYSVRIVQRASSAGQEPGETIDAALTVRAVDFEPVVRAAPAPFGSIRFLADDEPDSTVVVHYDALSALGRRSVSIGGIREWELPGRLRDGILGRMVGRVVAHEVGHWLLRWKGHSPSGLMRARQTPGELADPARRLFSLLPSDVRRLREALGS
jgi:hypothetical protein